jgi:hypothetical protein
MRMGYMIRAGERMSLRPLMVLSRDHLVYRLVRNFARSAVVKQSPLGMVGFVLSDVTSTSIMTDDVLAPSPIHHLFA